LPDAEALAQDVRLLGDAVRDAGALAMTLLKRDIRKWTKPDGSQVTEADLAVNDLLADRLKAARPGYGWLSEETPDGAERLGRERLWIVDPIDGTSDFAAGGSDWCIAAALVESGQPIVAAVYRPVHDEFYAALQGGGASLNGKPIAVADGSTLQGAIIMGNRKSLAGLMSAGIDARSRATLPLQLRLSHVAAGRLDGAVSIGQRSDWDLAAGDLLVREAGGRVTDTLGQPYVYNRAQTWQQGLVAAGAKRHAAIIAALRTT
jgi:myo-inositol-1(or 4)-monophosphatase